MKLKFNGEGSFTVRPYVHEPENFVTFENGDEVELEHLKEAHPAEYFMSIGLEVILPEAPAEEVADASDEGSIDSDESEESQEESKDDAKSGGRRKRGA